MFLIKRNAGFTIVELLIVIVVICILAAITILAYNGIQNRTYDTTIQSDLRNFGNKIMIYHAENGEYPKAGSRSGDSTKFPGITFQPTKNAYNLSVSTNLYYCDGTVAGSPAFVVMGMSKSRAVFSFSSYEGLRSRGNTSLSSSCYGFDTGSTGYSYGYNSGPAYGWFAWTNG